MILAVILLFIIVGVLLVIFIKVNLPIWLKIVILLSIFVSVISIRIVKGFMPMSTGMRHLAHLIRPPKDLYEPIVADNFLFYEKGFSRTYLLRPKYLNMYEIGLHSDKKNIPSTYKFKGKLKVEFFYKNRFLFEKTVTSYRAAWLVNGDSEHIKEISLLSFEMPLQGKYKDDVSIKITVLDPDVQLEPFKNSIKIYISVSAVP